MKRKGLVPRARLRDKLEGVVKRDREDPWAVDVESRAKKPLLKSFPFTVFNEMHKPLFPKVMVCLTAIVVVLFLNIINFSLTNTAVEGVSSLVNWNMDVTALPGGAIDVLSSLRRGEPEEGAQVPTSQPGLGLALPVYNASLLSDYGMREHPERGNEMHYGIDLVAPAGTEVTVVLDGTVLEVGTHRDYGSTVLVDHGDGLKSFYGRLADIKVEEGMGVASGDEIASIAQQADGESYLHFEVWVDGRPVNPKELLLED